MKVRAIKPGVVLDFGVDSDMRSRVRTGLEAPERIQHEAGDVFDVDPHQFDESWMEPVWPSRSAA